MAYNDDLLNAAQNRRRTGRSFFPAANYPQGQTLIGSRYGTSSAVLPPDQNPAYQAAIAKGRVNRNDMTTVYLPSGGTMQVPNKSLGGTLASIRGSTIQPKTAYATDYAKGYGALPPVIQGGYQISGGVANPIENLTPQQRIAGGAGSTSDYFHSNPALQAVGNLIPSNQQYAANLGSGLPNFSQIGQQLGTFGRNIANWFGGGRGAATQYGNTVSTGTGSAASFPMTVPPGINNLIPPPPLTGRPPNEAMFPTGAGGVLPFPSANPAQGTVTMANERFPGNVAPNYASSYPIPIQTAPRRYSDPEYALY